MNRFMKHNMNDSLATIIPVDWYPIHPKAQEPTKSHEADMAYDFYCVADDDFHNTNWLSKDKDERKCITLYPGDSHLFRTGLSIKMPDDYGLVLWDRSGLGAKHKIHRLAGVIDATYTGNDAEIKVSLINLGSKPYNIFEGDRIIQGIFQERIGAQFKKVDSLESTERGGKGFGSSGR